jgi:hypothetical protein
MKFILGVKYCSCDLFVENFWLGLLLLTALDASTQEQDM